MFEKDKKNFLVGAILDSISGENLYIWNFENEALIYKIYLGITLTDINHFGGWKEARAKHFADGANFDQIYEK